MSMCQRSCRSQLKSRTSKIPCLMRLLRHLLASPARFNFSFASHHVPGVSNRIADALSLSLAGVQAASPEATLFPVPVPHQLLEELTAPP